MTTTDPAPPTEATLTEWGDRRGVRRRRRRRPAPAANRLWRFVFPLLLVGLAVVAVDLWREGTKAVLDSTDGTLVEIESDPNAPGFEAFVSPTPTMLVLHTDGADQLVGVTVLARTLLDNGGQAVLVSVDLAVDGATLAEQYAAGGADAVEQTVGQLFAFGFRETLTLPTRDFAPLLGLVEPLPFVLLDDLVVTNDEGAGEVWLAAGRHDLDGGDAAELYSFRNVGEADVNRNERQLDLWTVWLQAISQADDLDAAALPFDDGLSPYLRAFAVGQRDLQVAPAVPTLLADGTAVYTFDDAGEEWLADLSERMTPLPIAPLGSDQPTVRLLDGVGDRRIAQAALDSMARLAEITIVGNAVEFGVTQTTVSYHDQAAAEAAQTLANRIGATAVFDPRPEDPVDLTVVIGTDWEAP